ncbi:MAG: M20 family metallopeptidase [Imperialibacter sp.]|uniref:M20 metallopeptidase family protein n=1 Tax=Imperialibacter sp. TaxID=2038411 RepID=UPI0032EEF57C
MDLKDRIKTLSNQFSEEIIGVRRHLHANPELSFEEYNTANYIREFLGKLPIDQTDEMATTGTVAIIKGKNPDRKIVALRADIDALPILEKNTAPYKSTNEGVMHACGHDVHTSSLLGVAKILCALKNEFEGTVKLIFQPGEEKLPGGASLMIKEGVLTNPSPKSLFGQHVMPLLPAGTVGFRPGMYMASADEIYVTVTGQGGHAAMPETLVDPIVVTAYIITALQQVVSRMASPKIPSVLSFGDIEGKGATNVIPSEVKLKGTFRTLNEEWRMEAHAKMKKMAEGIAESMGATCDFNIMKGYPFLANDEQLTNRSKSWAEEFLGKDKVVDLDIWMAAEDFAFYSHHIDSCFYRLGTRNDAKGITSGVHTPTFDIDESALELGVGLMTWLALKELTI